jgi:Leucine-rich repeat (LRR) protein
MEQAWLDSLSEDWVSQPRSGSPVQSLPSLSNSTSDSQARAASSRIPKYNAQKQSWTAGHDSANSPLSERSLNDNNIPLSLRYLRHPSKLREVTNDTRGRRLSRTLSASTSQSTQYHTIHHKSVSLSPQKGRNETPEWKRRLIHGDVAYGEQRDLFSPAGLENIFRPPPAQSPTKLALGEFEEGSLVIPSSPPPYNLDCTNLRKVDPSAEEQGGGATQNRQQPRVMKYKLAEKGESEFSENDLSRSSSFQPAKLKFQNEQRSGVNSDNTSDGASSVVRHDRLVDGAGRTVSGQSDMRNEELSPIYIGRHNTIDGKIDYAALDLPADELQRRLENIREESFLPSTENQEDTSENLPADITVETDDYAHNGHFVNLRRGGRSQEGSFQKRMLSPSSLPAIDESVMLPEESMQASTPKQLPNMKKTRASNECHQPQSTPASPYLPQAPPPSPTKSTGNEPKNPSGSPLKLFGTYDTFTNQTLLRRLSQFEGNNDCGGQVNIPSSTPHESTHPRMNEAFVAASSLEKVSQRSNIHQQRSRKVNSFGRGDLDNFQFSEEVSYNSSQSSNQDEDKENMTLPVLNPDTRTTFRFHLDPSPALNDDVVTQCQARYASNTSTPKQIITVRKTVRPTSSSSEQPPELPHCQRIEDLQTPRKKNGDTEGKRLPKSPLKDPTPKRRRTLHKTEITYEKGKEVADNLDSLAETHQQMQSVIGRKRKDARHDDDQQAANPTVLAMRQILRPRTPTPSQRSSQQHGRAALQEIDPMVSERGRLLQEKKIAKIQAELDSTEPLKASTALGVSQQMQADSRKGSVTTQDFLDEAKKIMAGIRGKARPRSGLTSLEESESENDRNQSAEAGVREAALEDSYQESTKEPFSRPPSREGAPLPRLPLKQEDPALLDYLRKYQEMSDMDEVIAESMKSIALAREAADSAKAIDRITDETISRKPGKMLRTTDGVESDPPNIRISENPDLQRKRKHSTSSVPAGDDEHHEAEFPSRGSNASSGQSTSRSIPTGSSRGSDSRRVIAPHSVSHLIPEQVAGMVFDRERNIWVKRKPVGEDAGNNFLPSDETEDDPFGGIPDLSVDETQELQRIKTIAAKQKETARVAQEHDEHRRTTNIATQQEKDGPSRDKIKLNNDELSEPSKLPRSTSSGGTVAESNTREISWRGERAPVAAGGPEQTHGVHHHHKSTHTEIREEVVEEVEREISIHEGRVEPASPPRRNVTISFSSPLASVIQAASYEDESSFDGGADEVNPSDSDPDVGDESTVITKNRTNHSTASTRSRSHYRSASRRLSLGGHKFSLRPVSRIDERDEDTISKDNEDRNRRSVSIVVSTPASSTREASVVLATPRPIHEVGTLTLTPLSEFTVHHADESFGLDVSYVAQRQRYVLGSNTQRTLSLSIKELVEKLTEVEPYEPFWEHIKEIDLKGKHLTNLHKLDEFCEQLEELDVSRNRISQLDGVPRTVRHLRISHNCLTDLAAWSHLRNLQYIDVSRNEIESLSAFKYLVHLRGLRADNNRIKSLDGIGQLDGLLSLRMRGNLVETINFSGTKLQRLTDLDLHSNKLSMVQNLQELRSLSTLNLEENKLSHFSLSDPEMLWSLKYLKLSGNNLESVDVSRYPNLRLLYLDRNRLGLVAGLLKTKHLDSLSLREQQTGARIDLAFLAEAFEVRKLFLSGNLLETFNPQVDFLNLQYLELANCGLQSLPPGLGQMISNTRVLNLNLNALRDISPLAGIIRLKKLHLAGNRLTRLRSTTCILAYFPNLTLADLRGNPLTLGFYPPLVEMRMILGDGSEDGHSDAPDPFTLGSADRGKDDKYAERLDMDTRMLRRVYEMLMLGGCLRIKVLDGLGIDRSVIQLEDEVWEALLTAGVLALPDPGKDQQEAGFPESIALGNADPGEVEQEDAVYGPAAPGKLDECESQKQEPFSQYIASENRVEEAQWPGEDSFA